MLKLKINYDVIYNDSCRINWLDIIYRKPNLIRVEN